MVLPVATAVPAIPMRASKRRISSLPSATLDHSSLRSRSSRKMLARSQSSRLVASRAIKSSSAPEIALRVHLLANRQDGGKFFM